MNGLKRCLKARGQDVKKDFLLFLISGLALLLCLPQTASSATSTIKVDAKAGVSSTHVKYATLAINDIVRFFSDNYHLGLHKKLRILLVPDDKEYAKVLARDFGYTQADAAKMSRTTGGMARDGNMEYIFAAKAKQNSPMDAFMHAACHEMVHWYQYAAGGNKSAQVKWLLEGTADVIGYNIVEAHLHGTLEKYRKRSLNVIRKAAAIPTLRELYSRKDWLAAMDRYGGNVIYSKAGLAVSELVQRQGLKSIFNYFLNLKKFTPAVAFERTFGMNLQNFERLIDQKIRK